METTPNDVIRTMTNKSQVSFNKMDVEKLIEIISEGGEFDRLNAINILCRVKNNLSILEECIEIDANED